MNLGHSRVVDAVLFWPGHLLWRLRHPSVRRCPRCKVNWEQLDDGRCHDCRAEGY